MKTHMKDARYNNYGACGLYNPERKTSNPDEVTCISCRKTKVWKEVKAKRNESVTTLSSDHTISLSFNIKEKMDINDFFKEYDGIEEILNDEIKIIDTFPDGKKLLYDEDNKDYYLLNITVNRLEIPEK